jgi:hypothetical protein
VLIFFLVFSSCSKDEDECICEKWLLTPLGGVIGGGGPIDDDVDLGYCTGEIANPNPRTIHFERRCI